MTRARSTPRAKVPRHAHAAGAHRAVVCAIVTVSDSRGRDDDASGDRAQRLLEGAGHRVAHRDWVRDDARAIRATVRRALARPPVDAVIVTGGTGVAPRDVTPEALEPLVDTPLPGFGERFRARSEAHVGASAWLSRASAGIARGRLLVWLPGSTRAVSLALEELILPELGHVLRLIGRLTSKE